CPRRSARRVSMADRTRILITMGDVAGIGPEIIARAWPEIEALADAVVIGDRMWLERAQKLFVSRPLSIPCVAPPTPDLGAVRIGEISAAAGRAAYEFLHDAIRRTRAGEADAIVTCPLHKEGLHAVGVPFPVHTEMPDVEP